MRATASSGSRLSLSQTAAALLAAARGGRGVPTPRARGVMVQSALLEAAVEAQPETPVGGEALIQQYTAAMRAPEKAIEKAAPIKATDTAAVEKAIAGLTTPMTALRLRKIAEQPEDFNKMLCFLLDVRHLQKCYIDDCKSAEWSEIAEQDGIAANCREDGRSNLELRPIALEMNALATEFGSVRASNGESAVLVSVRAELVPPDLRAPTAGEVFVNVWFSSPAEVDRKLAVLGEDHVAHGLALGATLKALLFSPEVFPREALCVSSGLYVWHLYVDVLVLAIGGSLADLAGLAIVAALRTARLPAVDIVADVGFEAVLGEDPNVLGGADAGSLRIRLNPAKPRQPIPNAELVPLLVSVGVIGNSVVADLTLEEANTVSHVIYGAVCEQNNAFRIAGLLKAGGAALSLQILSSINLRLVNVAKSFFATFCSQASPVAEK